VAWELAHRHLPRSAVVAKASGPPPEFIPWFCGHIFLGYLSPPRARLLAAHLAPIRMQAHRLDWDAGQWSAPARSAALQETLLRLRALGHLPGWRNEAFAFCTEGGETYLLQAERAGFYFLGMRSDAVHVNGFRADARMWVARRSAAKQVDPGLLDNLCAGGVAAGETLEKCLQRELHEEAGIRLAATHLLRFRGTTEVGRVRDGGWHVERLHVYNLLLQANEQPCNRDGEVQEFLLLSAAELAGLVHAEKCTPDAAAAIVQGLYSP
jgi:8-oxo-dGTP pyrophosphatase MutT (NUDIX family)